MLDVGRRIALMRIKKFRLAEAMALAFLATAGIVGATSDWHSALAGQNATPLGMSVPTAYLAALGMFVLAFWLARDAIRRR
jgi:hypothetical protein